MGLRDGFGGRERLSAGPLGDPTWAAANLKIVLSRSRDIPFNKLRLSQANVRRVKAGISIEQLAEDIAHRGLLHGLPAVRFERAAGPRP